MANTNITINFPDEKQAQILQYMLPEIELILLDNSIDYSGMTTKQKISKYLQIKLKELYKKGKFKSDNETASASLKQTQEENESFIDDLGVS